MPSGWESAEHRRAERQRAAFFEVSRRLSAARTAEEAARIIVGVAHEHQHAIIMRAAIGNAAQRRDECLVVARIRFRLAGVARTVDARRAAERVDAQPRVVGERVQPGEPGEGDRLLLCVLGERVAVLLHLRGGPPEVLRRDDADGQPGEPAGAVGDPAVQELGSAVETLRKNQLGSIEKKLRQLVSKALAEDD